MYFSIQVPTKYLVELYHYNTLCIKSNWEWEESWPTVCVIPFLPVMYVLQFKQIIDSQLVVFYAPITDEVFYR